MAEATKAAGAHLLPLVTTVDEARRAVACGASAVITQGAEAGGHRGTFGVGGASGPAAPALVGTLALVPQVVDAVGPDVPVIASGGIMDGRGIVAVLALGGQGVSLGTAFLGSAESGAVDAYAGALAVTAGEEHRRDRPRHGPPGALGAQPPAGRAGRGRAPARSAGGGRRRSWRTCGAPQPSRDAPISCRCWRARAPRSAARASPRRDIVARLVRESEAALAGLAARA